MDIHGPALFNRPTRMFIFRLIIRMIIIVALFAVLLFSTAGTWAWWRAWVLLGLMIVGMVASTMRMLSGHKDLLVERLKPLIQRGQPLTDKIILLLYVSSYVGLFCFIPEDVFHWHLMSQPGMFVSSFGMVLFLAGARMVSLAMRENRFAAAVVKHQEDRHHEVIDTGVYSVVRHPMYAGIIPMLVGASLWLESYAAALAALVPAGLLAVRILVEERFLKRELDGYDAYTKRVRYRLIPFLW
jgi:protein-S-isoprenylcysteine O-methyltransferase Ste14